VFSKQEKLIIFTLAFIQFCHIVDFMILMPLGPVLMRSFNITPQEFSLLVASYTFSAGASGLLSAFFIDRFDRKTLLVFLVLGFSIGTIACALSLDYISLLISRSLTGVFGGVLGSVVFAIISDAINAERRGTAMGLLMTSFSVASIFGVPFSLFLANQFNWHAPFFFLGFISLLLVFLIIKSIPQFRSHIATDGTASWKNSLLFFKNKNQMIALVFISFLVLGQFSVIPFLSPSLVANVGLKESQLPLIYLIGGIFTIISSPWVGRLADQKGKRKVFYYGGVFSFLPILLVTNMKPVPLYAILIVAALFFMAMGARMVPAMAIASSTVAPQQRGSFMSVLSSVQNFSAAMAAYLAGQIVVKNENGYLENYHHVGWLAVALSFLAIYFVSKVVSVDGKI
jgi:DHA1 family inner membrane transport protein